MSSESGKEQTDKKVIHLDMDEHLPAVPNSSPAAEVVKQIIEQILANERKRARMEFIRIFSIFLVFLFAVLGTGIWFARQLLAQLREERQLTELSWRMMTGGAGGVLPAYPVDKTALSRYPAAGAVRSKEPKPPVLNREAVAKLEQNIRAVSELLKTKPQESSASIREMLQDQQNAIQALSARLNEAQEKIAGAEAGANAAPEEIKQSEFIAAPVAEDLKLRMPIP